MNLPLVSIIIPTYNQRPEFLKACIQSAIQQTYQNVEIIISDNHSTNGAEKIFSGFSDSRIKVIKPESHLGLIDNFNFAAKAAQGEYISFLSSDDLLYPECIVKVVMPMLHNNHISLSYCENAIINESGNTQLLIRKGKLPTGIYSRKQAASRMYNFSEYWVIGGIMRNDHFKQTGFPKEIIAGDWVLGFKLLKYGDAAYCNEVLSAIRFHERQGTATAEYADRHLLNNLQRVKKHEWIIEDKELLEKIGVSKKQAIAYRDKEITGSAIVLTRQYHNKVVSEEIVKKTFAFYKKYRSGYLFNLFTRYYKSKLVLLATYVYGFNNRVLKFFKVNI
jgi:glycosyltransferase involved in cell wall biosynthesis